MASRHTAIALVAAALLPQVQADCYSDRYGNYRCTGLSGGARIGIGIAIAAAGLILICLAGWIRQRRMAQVNKSYITQGGQQPYQPGYYPPPQPGQYYGAPPPEGQYGGWQPPPGAQYPPHAYTGEANSGPGQYAPPPGAPTQRNYDPDGPPTYPGPPQEAAKQNQQTNF